MHNSSKMPSIDDRTVTTYPEAKLQHTELLKLNIIETAASIMQEYGPEAVTIRRVAEKWNVLQKLFITCLEARKVWLNNCFWKAANC